MKPGKFCTQFAKILWGSEAKMIWLWRLLRESQMIDVSRRGKGARDVSPDDTAVMIAALAAQSFGYKLTKPHDWQWIVQAARKSLEDRTEFVVEIGSGMRIECRVSESGIKKIADLCLHEDYEEKIRRRAREIASDLVVAEA